MSRVSATVREQVRRRAGDRCEYCRRPEGIGSLPHHVDHIIPIKHSGSSKLDNLAWACYRCNTTKSRDVSSYDPVTKSLTPLYHPRIHAWDNHFELDGTLIVGKTPIGRVTIIVLEMNHDKQLVVRQKLINAGLW